MSAEPVGLRIIRVEPMALTDVFTKGSEWSFRVTKGLPEGATLVNVMMDDPHTSLVLLKFAHPDWKCETGPIPTLPIEVEYLKPTNQGEPCRS